jgi:hypothetical protein
MNFNIIRSKNINSSNVKSYKYNTKTKELEIVFNDGSKYKYYDVDYNDFENITYGDATCITEGENEYGSWFVGKSPSVGAAIWEFLINKNKRYEEMSIKGKLKKINVDRLPLYEIFINDDDETGMDLISVVENPAIEIKGFRFNEILDFSFKKDGDKQIIVGPALIPDKKIRRIDEDGNEYYVFFSKETISKMVEKFNRVGSNRKINFEHTDRMIDAFIMEDWIVENEVYDKSKIYGFEVPVGTYMIKVKFDDSKFWEEEVKGNDKFGFSIEGILGQSLVKMSEEKDIFSEIDSLTKEELEDIYNFLKKF